MYFRNLDSLRHGATLALGGRGCDLRADVSLTRPAERERGASFFDIMKTIAAQDSSRISAWKRGPAPM
jgi:hypothetical protein